MPQVDVMIQKFQITEQIFVHSNEDKTNTIPLKDFLIKNFQIPNDDLERICNYISKDTKLERIIFDLPGLIQSRVQYEKLQINFNDELEDGCLHLEVGIFSSLDIKNSLKLENSLEEQLYDLYDWDSCDKVILNVE